MNIATFFRIMSENSLLRITRDKSGLSLLELMIVIGIIAVACATAIPIYNATIKPTAHLNGAARLLYSDIQLARLRAINQNVRYGVAFLTGLDRYIVFIDKNSNNQRDGGDQEVKTIDLANEYPCAGFDTAQGGGHGNSFANSAFAITSRALATNAGSVFLTNTKGEGREISVGMTGVPRIEEY